MVSIGPIIRDPQDPATLRAMEKCKAHIAGQNQAGGERYGALQRTEQAATFALTGSAPSTTTQKQVELIVREFSQQTTEQLLVAQNALANQHPESVVHAMPPVVQVSA